MRTSNNKIGTDHNVNTKSNNLIDTGINSTSNSFHHARVPILMKETTIRTLIFTLPQPNKKVSATSKAKQSNRSPAEATCEKFIGPYPSIFYNLLDHNQRKNYSIENTVSRQHKSSEKDLRHSTNMDISHEYLNKIKNLKYIHLDAQPALNLFNSNIPNTIRVQVSKYLPDPKYRLIAFISTKYKSRGEALIGSETEEVVYSLRYLI